MGRARARASSSKAAPTSRRSSPRTAPRWSAVIKAAGIKPE